MKINYLFILLFTFFGVVLTSCIKEEADTMESDIITATIVNEKEYLNTNTTVTATNVFFRLKPEVKERSFAPIFTLSEGSSISPENGSLQDFSSGPVIYTVTSKDGKWQKKYNVSFLEHSFILEYSFEDVQTIIGDNPYGIYHEFIELLPNHTSKNDWTSGNFGFNILAQSLLDSDDKILDKTLTPDFYPTSSTVDGYIGKGVKMITKDTGPLGIMFGSSMAAGNLYLGTFNFTLPAIQSTRFGIPYASGLGLPSSITGFFKYKAGEKFVNNSGDSKRTKDTWDVYAIIFEMVDGNKNYLPGDHDFRNEKMVAVAKLTDKDRIETDQWTEFEIPFEVLPGKVFNNENTKYMYTIVCSSSIEGAKFNGALGSTLCIDEIKLNFEK